MTRIHVARTGVWLLLALMCGCGGPPALPPDAAALVGRWMREDGGYILEVKSASADGTLAAAYLNPNPIHISQAKWQRDAEEGTKVLIVLTDTGYPDATYRLHHRGDTFVGTYTQPAIAQTFDVTFTRQP